MDNKKGRKRKKISWSQRMSQDPDFFDNFRINHGTSGHTWVRKNNFKKKRGRTPDEDYPEEE